MARIEDIAKIVPEESTIVFQCRFLDESGNSVAPVSVNWDLTDVDGTVIAYNQSVSSPDTTTYIVLHGSYLRILRGDSTFEERLLTIRATYNSTYGSGLPLNKQIKFKIQNLRMIGYPINSTSNEMIFSDDYISVAVL